MKKIGYDQIKIAQTKIVEDSKCCLKVNAVISKAGVYLYEDGWALKPKMELLKASTAIRYAGAKLTLHKHPDSKVIMSQRQLAGGIEKTFFERDRIRATLNFDKALTPGPLIVKIRETVVQKTGLDVSIGFYYEHVPRSGFAADVNTGKKRAYDYVMRDILIDHVAVMFDGDNLHGRCTYPNCGIGVDTMIRGIGLDPFGIYKDFAECVAKNQEKGNPEAYCASIYEKIKGKWPGEKSAHRYVNKKRKSKGGKIGMTTEPIEHEEVLKQVSEYETRYPDRSEAFRECVRTRVEEGMTFGEAEAHCEPPTLPEDEPAPPPGSTGTAQEEPTPYEKCITAKVAEGMTREEAEEACKGEKVGDQELVDKTPMERCVAEQVDAGKTEEEAQAWCMAELEGKTEADALKFVAEVEAGEYRSAGDLIAWSTKRLQMKEQRDIERQRAARRRPR